MSARGGGGGYGGGASPLGGYGPPSRMSTARETFGPVSFPPNQPWFPLGSFDLFRFATPFGTFGLLATPLVAPVAQSSYVSVSPRAPDGQGNYGIVPLVAAAVIGLATTVAAGGASIFQSERARAADQQAQAAAGQANPCVAKLDAKLAAIDARKIGWGKKGHDAWKAEHDATKAKRDQYAMDPMSCPEVQAASAAEQQAALLAAEDAKSAASQQSTMLWVGGGVATVALLSVIALAARRRSVKSNPRRSRSRRRSR